MPEDNVTPMNDDELRSLVAEVTELPVDEITDDARLVEDLGVDSLVSLELSLRLEERFGITLTEREMKEIGSFAAIRALLSDRVGGGSAA